MPLLGSIVSETWLNVAWMGAGVKGQAPHRTHANTALKTQQVCQTRRARGGEPYGVRIHVVASTNNIFSGVFCDSIATGREP